MQKIKGGGGGAGGLVPAFTSWHIGQEGCYNCFFFPGCNFMDFEIKLIFLIELFFYITKKSWKKVIENEKSY